jgi:carbon starvation protein CstA
MKTAILYLASLALVLYTFYLRVEEGSAGWLAVLAVPAIFYLIFTSTYIVSDTKKGIR